MLSKEDYQFTTTSQSCHLMLELHLASDYFARSNNVHALFRVMDSVHALKQFWNSRHSHHPIRSIWNGNICSSVLEWFCREWSHSHCLVNVPKQGISSAAVVKMGYEILELVDKDQDKTTFSTACMVFKMTTHGF